MKQFYLYCTPNGSEELTDVAHIPPRLPVPFWHGFLAALAYPWGMHRRFSTLRFSWAPSLLLYAALATLLAIWISPPAGCALPLSIAGAMVASLAAILWNAARIRSLRNLRRTGGSPIGFAAHPVQGKPFPHKGHHGKQHGGRFGAPAPYGHEPHGGHGPHGKRFGFGDPMQPFAPTASVLKRAAGEPEANPDFPAEPVVPPPAPAQEGCIGECPACQLTICAKSGRPNPRRRRS